ncbi:MAG: ATP-binding cassette domain-containing protein [Terriglobia bacterium]|jgi:ABC-2 type transport system ATP-binding protein|nr:ATP-binding cassette domain-containing protein [Terriglobia bacterium]
MTNTLELHGITKRYDSFTAVDSLSFSIPQGCVYGLLGPNGAGKTTTIRMMIGITLPDSGEVWMFGERFRTAHLDRVGYLPEERGLYKRMKISELLSFFAQLKGISRVEADKRAARWLERLDLQQWAKAKAEELSKGMQQKVQFIASVLHDPEFVIMDEFSSGLDPANARDLENILLELRKAGKTILFSTHRMDQVEKLCDEITLVNHGRAVLQGELRAVKASYGKSSVEIEYDGDTSFLERKDLVQSFHNSGNRIELKLAPGADSQSLLRLAADKARISKFELVEPSLEEIFIDVVSAGKNGGAALNGAAGVTNA